MQKETAKSFLQDNADALILLSEKIELARKINTESNYTEETRALAIELVECWITEVFGCAYNDEAYPKPPEDNLYKRLKNHHHLDDE